MAKQKTKKTKKKTCRKYINLYFLKIGWSWKRSLNAKPSLYIIRKFNRGLTFLLQYPVPGSWIVKVKVKVKVGRARERRFGTTFEILINFLMPIYWFFSIRRAFQKLFSFRFLLIKSRAALAR